MPVFMVKANAKTLEEQPSWLVDLHKIYTEGFAASPASFPASFKNAPDFIDETLMQPNCWFAGALFNDHLLGAVLVTETADSWQLSCLNVRKVTQRRGVATRLLTLLAAQAEENSLPLCITKVESNAAVEALVGKLATIINQ